MKGGTCTKPLAKIQVTRIFRTRYPKKCFTQIYRDLYGDAMLVLLDEHQHGGRKPAKTSVTEFWYKSVNLFLEQLINI